MRALILWTLLMSTCAISLSAQLVGPEIEVGERVRIDRVREGTVVQRDGRSLVIQPLGAESAATKEIALSQVSLLEARRCCNRGKGFVYGALAGVGASLLGGVILQNVPTSAGSGANMAMAGGIVLAVPLGIVGGTMGSTLFAPTHWVEVNIPRH